MNTHVRIERALDTGGERPERGRGGQLVRSLSSDSLFQGTREIAIEHGEATYRLKITRQGKLILNK